MKLHLAEIHKTQSTDSFKNIKSTSTKEDKKPIGSPLLKILLKRATVSESTGNILADIL